MPSGETSGGFKDLPDVYVRPDDTNYVIHCNWVRKSLN